MKGLAHAVRAPGNRFIHPALWKPASLKMTLMECELIQDPTRFRGSKITNQTSEEGKDESGCGTNKERDESMKPDDDKPKNRKVNTKKLLCIKEMPDHLQFNPYILKGYRPLQPPIGCVKSLFQLHNETVNIFTHAIPIFYIILTVPEVLPWHSKELTFLAWCHIAGILCPWLGSFLYHMFMNLNYGPMAYYVLLQIDMVGIWTSQSIGALPLVFATTKCLPQLSRWFLITFYCALSIWGLYKAMVAWSPWERRLCFLLPFLNRIGLWFLRLTKLGGGDPAAFVHVILQDAVSILGACIGAIHVPEKWFPGSVDLILNSHNIMHVLVVAAVWSMHQATALDLHWMAKNQCNL